MFFIIIIIIGIKALSKAITFGIIYLTTNTLNNNIPKVMVLYRHNNEQGLQFHPWLCWNSTALTLKNQNTIEALS